MKISISVDADSVEEAREAFASLVGGPTATSETTKAPTRRGAKTIDVGPASDSSVNATAAGATTTAVTEQQGPATLETIRSKIASMQEKKEDIVKLFGDYVAKDGTPVTRPSSLKEEDYQSFFNDLLTL